MACNDCLKLQDALDAARHLLDQAEGARDRLREVIRRLVASLGDVAYDCRDINNTVDRASVALTKAREEDTCGS